MGLVATMTWQAVIFDLDGTLLDTLADIAESNNQALAEQGLPTFPIDVYRTKIGDGVDTLARRTVPLEKQTEELLAAVVARNKEIYATRWDRKTRLYEGISEMLDNLEQRKIRASVLSNKPHHLTVQCVSHFFSGRLFQHVYGVGGNIPKKPDTTGVDAIINDWGLARDQVLYVGDTDTDMKTAKAAGLYALGVTWGFREREELAANGADRIIDHPREMIDPDWWKG